MAEEELLDQTDNNEDVYQQASTIKRLINYFVDYTFITLVTLLYMDLTGSGEISDNPMELYPTFSYYVLFPLVTYYIVSEGIFGRTIGKVITKTHLVDSEGYKPTFFKVAIRTLCRFIPFEPVSFLIPGINGWHDSISGTRVIEEVKG